MLDPSIRLRTAIVEGKQLIVARLLSRFPDLLDNIDSTNGWSNLHYAVFHNRLEITHLLLDLIEEKSSRAHRSLAVPGELLTVEDVVYTFEGYTVLHVAALRDTDACLELLLQYFHLVLNACDRNGQTALQIAAMHGHTACARLLINNGADLNAQDSQGNTALHLAASFGHAECIKLLLFAECNDDIKNHESWKAYDLCSTFELQKQYNVFKLSLETAHRAPPASAATSKVSSPATTTLRPYSNSLPPLPAITTRRHSASSQASSFSSESNKPATPLMDTSGSNYTYQSPLQDTTLADLIDPNSKSPLVPANRPFAPNSARTNTMSSASSVSTSSSPPHAKRKEGLTRKTSSSSLLSPSKNSASNKSPQSKRSSMSTRTFRSNSNTSETSAPLVEPRSKSGSFSSTLSSITSTFKSEKKQTGPLRSMTSISFRPQGSRKNSVTEPDTLQRTRSVSSSSNVSSPLRARSGTTGRQPLLLKNANTSSVSLGSQSSGGESVPDRSHDSASTLTAFKQQNSNRLKLSLKLNTLYHTNTNDSVDSDYASPTRLESGSRILSIPIKSSSKRSA